MPLYDGHNASLRWPQCPQGCPHPLLVLSTKATVSNGMHPRHHLCTSSALVGLQKGRHAL